MSTKPRILHVLSQRPGRSGSGVFLASMVREAARRGYPQHVVAAGPAGTDARELPPLDAEAFSLIEFPSPAAPFPVPGNSDVMPYPSSVFSTMSEVQIAQYLEVTRARLLEARARFEPDIVHAHHLWLMSSMLREIFPDLPLLVTAHNVGLRQLLKAPHLGGQVRAGIRELDRVCVLTEQSRRETIDVYGVSPDRIHVTQAGFRDDLFAVDPQQRSRAQLRAQLEQDYGVTLPPGPDEPGGTKILMYIGRTSTAKGIPFLLEAARAIEGRARLVFVGATGSGADGEQMDALVAAAGGLVIHTGAVPQAAVALALRCADGFVLPSLCEGLPLVMLEALASGVPCVVSELPTVRSWVPEDWRARGWVRLVPALEVERMDEPVAADVPRFVDDWRAALEALVAAPEPSAKQREAMSTAMREHTWGAVFERYEQVYAELR